MAHVEDNWNRYFKEARPVDEPGRTQTTGRETGVLIPPG